MRLNVSCGTLLKLTILQAMSTMARAAPYSLNGSTPRGGSHAPVNRRNAHSQTRAAAVNSACFTPDLSRKGIVKERCKNGDRLVISFLSLQNVFWTLEVK